MEYLFPSNLPLAINFIRLVATVFAFISIISLIFFILFMLRDFFTINFRNSTASAFIVFQISMSTLICLSVYCLLNTIGFGFFDEDCSFFQYILFYLGSILAYFLLLFVLDIIEKLTIKVFSFSSALFTHSSPNVDVVSLGKKGFGGLSILYLALFYTSIITRIISICSGYLWSILLFVIEFLLFTVTLAQSGMRCRRTSQSFEPAFHENNSTYQE